jgi:nicotine blue oxidoreductase
VIDGVRLVDRAVDLLARGGCDPVVVVLGAWVGEVPRATVVVNPRWHDGMGSSLSAGLAALEDAPVDRVVVTLVDLVGLTVDAVLRVTGVDADLAAATYGGRRGHPVLLGRRHWPGVTAAAVGDRGARDYLDAHADELTSIEVGDVATDTDLDHPPTKGNHGRRDTVRPA